MDDVCTENKLAVGPMNENGFQLSGNQNDACIPICDATCGRAIQKVCVSLTRRDWSVDQIIKPYNKTANTTSC